MPVIFTRIDDRLVHGQVVQGWIPNMAASELAVVSDEVAADGIRSGLMRLSLHEGIKLNILTVADAAAYLAKAQSSPARIMVLAAGPSEILKLAEAGVPFESVNVGGMHYAAGKMQIGRALFLDAKDKAALRALSHMGIKLEGRGVPSDPQEDIIKALEN